MNKQLTIRQLLDQVVEQLNEHVYNAKWLVESGVNDTMQGILRENGFEGGIVRFTKSSWTSSSSSFVLVCPNRNMQVHVTLRLKQVKETATNVLGRRFTEVKWSVKDLETFGEDGNLTIAEIIAKDAEIKEQREKQVQDTKDALFELMDDIGYERFKNFAKFYNDNRWTLDREYEARA